MNKNTYVSLAVAAGIVASLAVVLPAFASAQTVNVGFGGGAGMSGHFRGGPGPAMIPGVFGTVTAVSGDSLTVTSKAFRGFRNNTSTSATASSTVYTVDATNATIYKNGATSTISSIVVNDTVSVQGTVSGTSVTATTIRDGVVPGMMGGKPGMMGKRGYGFGRGASSTAQTSPIQGNGEPVIGGSVTAISSTTLTVTNKSNVTYTVDASSATIIKNGTSTTLSNVAVGDNLIVQGTVNGTSVTASSVIDQGVGAQGNGSSTPAHSGGGSGFGFLGAIGSFFKRIFGF